MIKRIAILLSLILVFMYARSQHSKTDSLYKAFSKATEDTVRVNILNELYKEYQFNDPEKALKFSLQALKLAEKINFPKGTASSLNNIGFYYYNQDSGSKALVYFSKANDIFTQIENNRGIAIVNANIGNLFYSQGNYKKAHRHRNAFCL